MSPEDAFGVLCLRKDIDGLDRAYERLLMFMRSIDDWEEKQVMYHAFITVRQYLASIQIGERTLTRPCHRIQYLALIVLLYQDYKSQDQEDKDVVVGLRVALEEVYDRAIKRLSVRVRRSHVYVQKDIYISLLDLMPQYRFEGQGDEGVDGHVGDIVVHVHVLDHHTHRIDSSICKYDLHTTISVPLLDYLYGSEYDIKHLDGSVLRVRYDAQSAQRVVVLNNKGLPKPSQAVERGSLYIFFDVVLPTLPQERLCNPVTRMLLCKLFRHV